VLCFVYLSWPSICSLVSPNTPGLANGRGGVSYSDVPLFFDCLDTIGAFVLPPPVTGRTETIAVYLVPILLSRCNPHFFLFKPLNRSGIPSSPSPDPNLHCSCFCALILTLFCLTYGGGEHSFLRLRRIDFLFSRSFFRD